MIFKNFPKFGKNEFGTAEVVPKSVPFFSNPTLSMRHLLAKVLLLTVVIPKEKSSILLPNELEASPLIFGFSLLLSTSEKNRKGKKDLVFRWSHGLGLGPMVSGTLMRWTRGFQGKLIFKMQTTWVIVKYVNLVQRKAINLALIKVKLPHAVYACFYCTVSHFRSDYIRLSKST